MNHRLLIASLVVVVLCGSYAPAAAPTGDWPQWRGPERDGHSADRGLLQEWPEEGPPVLWRVDTVGVGYSSLAIRDGRIYTQGDLDGIEHILCLEAATGKTIWAVQPEPVAQQLAERVAEEFERLDENSDGRIDEVEALARLGFAFNKFDKPVDGDAQQLAEQRAARLFEALDADGDGQLSAAEAGRPFYKEMERIDRPEPNENAETAKPEAEKLARARAAAWLAAYDADDDQSISREEAKKSIVNEYFGRIDERDPETKKGDDQLTTDEIVAYFVKREAGKDGQISRAELTNYFADRYPGGDGQLSRAELKGYFGGYRNGQGDGPRGTPTLDGDRLYCEGGNGDVTCLDAKTGKTIWHVSLTADFGGGRPGWGYSESPLIVGDRVIVTPGGKQGTVLALDKNSGEPMWRSEDVTEGAHYSSPILAKIHDTPTIVQFARESVFGLSLDGGRFLWKYSGANNGTANCATPIVDDNRVFASSAYGTGGGLAEIVLDGSVPRAEEVYFEKKMANHHGGIVKVGDYMYGFGSGLLCMDFKTGDIAWQDRSVGKGSLCVADGMLYLLSERHEVALAEATPEAYREHGRFKIESHGRPSWAHPVVTGGVFYIRDQQSLTAYDVRKK